MLRSFLFLGLVCAISGSAWASGQLDPEFDQDGVLITNLSPFESGSDTLTTGMVDSKGRYVATGEALQPNDLGGLVVRLLPSGQRDLSFGDNGVAGVPLLAPYSDVGFIDIAEQADGKLVVAGRAANSLPGSNPGRAYVCRLLESGAMDLNFGDDGCVSPDFAAESLRDNLVGMALQADGQIVFTGVTDQGNDGLPYEYVVGRLQSNGSYDPCFGNVACTVGGLLVEPEPDNTVDFNDFLTYDIAVAANGDIVVAGRAHSATSNDMGVIRILADGSVDAGFGIGGHRTVAFNRGDDNSDSANAVLVRDDGSIVLAGFADGLNDRLAAVAGLDAGGQLLMTFGAGGKQLLYFNDVSPGHVATGLLEQDDGKIVLVGQVDFDMQNEPYSDDCGVARLSIDGVLDPVFGFSGVNNLDSSLGELPNLPDRCTGLASDGKHIVLFGLQENTDWDSLIMRLDQDDLFGDGFEDAN